MILRHREWMLVSIVVSCAVASCQVSGDSTDDPTQVEASELIGPACSSVCDCPLGYNSCDDGVCRNDLFSPVNPNPPGPSCGAACQCPGSEYCLRGANPGYCIGPATMTASSNPVIVPAGQTTATFTLSWNAPGANQVDLYGEQNLQNPGQTLFLGTGAASGTAPAPMSVGEDAWLWLYFHGDTTKPIATLEVTGRH